MFPLAFHALNQLIDSNSRHDLAAAQSTVHLLPVPAAAAANPVDFRETRRLIAAASYDLVRASLQSTDRTVGRVAMLQTGAPGADGDRLAHRS